MGYIIGVAGKGGTGKTTIASLVVRYLRENKLGSVLAIDADPNSNFGQTLGLAPRENIGAIIDEIAKDIGKIPAGMTKERYIEYRLQSAMEESDGLDLLALGRPEGPGCYCYANNVLRGIITKVCEDYDFVVIDNEAGLEHLSRRTMRKADCLFIISDATPVGLKSAERIYDLIKELNITIKKFVLVVNRVKNKEINIDNAARNKIGEFKLVFEDSDILEFSNSGRPITGLEKDSPAFQSISKIMNDIIPAS